MPKRKILHEEEEETEEEKEEEVAAKVVFVLPYKEFGVVFAVLENVYAYENAKIITEIKDVTTLQNLWDIWYNPEHITHYPEEEIAYYDNIFKKSKFPINIGTWTFIKETDLPHPLLPNIKYLSRIFNKQTS